MTGLHRSDMPGPRAPAFSLFAKRLALLVAPVAMLGVGPTNAAAQQPPAGQAPPSIQPVPDSLELAKLIWSTMAAVDHANRSGNYSVLRDISANGFQIQNDPSRLAQVFAGIRASRIDLANALLVPPTYTAAPQLLQGNVMRTQGLFQLRPVGIRFDLYFQWEQGRWKLFGIDLQPLEMAGQVVPVSPSQSQPQPRQQQPGQPRR